MNRAQRTGASDELVVLVVTGQRVRSGPRVSRLLSRVRVAALSPPARASSHICAQYLQFRKQHDQALSASLSQSPRSTLIRIGNTSAVPCINVRHTKTFQELAEYTREANAAYLRAHCMMSSTNHHRPARSHGNKGLIIFCSFASSKKSSSRSLETRRPCER